MKENSWIVCVMFRKAHSELEYLVVTPKPRQGEPFVHQLPFTARVDSNSAMDLALTAAKVDTGIKPVIIDERFYVDRSGEGDAVEFFLGKVLGDPELPKLANTKTRWLPFEDAVKAVNPGVFKEGLERAEHRLRQILPGPFIRHGVDPEFKPVLRRVIDLCGPAWAQLEYECQSAKPDGVKFYEDHSLDLIPFMSVHAVEAVLHAYFKRMAFLVDEHTLCIAGPASDSRKISLERLNTDWDKMHSLVEKRFPLAYDVLSGMVKKAKSYDEGWYDEYRAEPGSETEKQLRTVMAVYPYKYAMMERKRVIYAMASDGRVLARGLSLCPERFRRSTVPSTLLQNIA